MRVFFTLVLAVSMAVSTFLWFNLLYATQQAAAKFGKSWTSAFQMDSPEFWPAFRESLGELSNLGTLLRFSGVGPVFLLLAATALVIVFVRGTEFPSSAQLDLILALALTALPTIVGLGMVPAFIRSGFQALATQGLSAPDIVASVVGESFAPFFLGLLLSTLLAGFVGYLWWRHSREAVNG